MTTRPAPRHARVRASRRRLLTVAAAGAAAVMATGAIAPNVGLTTALWHDSLRLELGTVGVEDVFVPDEETENFTGNNIVPNAHNAGGNYFSRVAGATMTTTLAANEYMVIEFTLPSRSAFPQAAAGWWTGAAGTLMVNNQILQPDRAGLSAWVPERATGDMGLVDMAWGLRLGDLFHPSAPTTVRVAVAGSAGAVPVGFTNSLVLAPGEPVRLDFGVVRDSSSSPGQGDTIDFPSLPYTTQRHVDGIARPTGGGALPTTALRAVNGNVGQPVGSVPLLRHPEVNGTPAPGAVTPNLRVQSVPAGYLGAMIGEGDLVGAPGREPTGAGADPEAPAAVEPGVPPVDVDPVPPADVSPELPVGGDAEQPVDEDPATEVDEPVGPEPEDETDGQGADSDDQVVETAPGEPGEAREEAPVAADPAPEPDPAPAPESDPAREPEPAPEPAPAPEPDPTPEPVDPTEGLTLDEATGLWLNPATGELFELDAATGTLTLVEPPAEPIEGE